MHRPSKWLTAGLLASLLVGLFADVRPLYTAPVTPGPGDRGTRAQAVPPESSPPLTVPLALPAALAEAARTDGALTDDALRDDALRDDALTGAEEGGDPSIELDLVTAAPEDLAAVRREVEAAGGEVLFEERTYAQVRVPASAASSFLESVQAMAVSQNQPVSTDLTEPAPAAKTATVGAVGETARINLDAIGAVAFRQSLGVSGAGVKVAIIDSGIDPGHPDLQRTPDGSPKVIDWKDFTSEGQVSLPNEVIWGAEYTAPDGRVYRLPPKPASSRVARFGFWEESRVPGRINRDLDRNGSPVDRFGVLAVDSTQPGVYDLVYVDTNNDGSFLDEQPLRVFRESGDWRRLGRFRIGDAARSQLAFVLADLDPSGTSLSFGFDSLGHGTQVAGVAAAYGAADSGGMEGVAPGAQLLALKVITSRDEGDWFAVREAIQYAAEQGAKVINVSLGGLPIAAAYDSAASAWLNETANRYDVLIVFAAGNNGPGLSSGATLGSPSDILSIGAYYSPAMWQRDFGVVVPSEGVWWQSAMGPRSDGSLVPNLIAPGGSPTTSPHWLDSSGYTTASGTSIAVPHVTGAAALLLELAQREGLPQDHRSLRRSMEQGARRLSGVGEFEQGAGLLSLLQAYQELRAIRQVPALAATGPAGGDGLYNRAYRPGNDAFTLTNLTGSATLINVVTLADWVQPAFHSMTIPAWGTRELPLLFNPPTQPGVHAAALQLLHPDQGVPSITLPITYVRPVTLDAQQRYSATEQLEVARYRRYFVEVAEGASNLRVNARVQTGFAEDGGTVAQGTVQVQVFRPDGQMLYRSGAIGAKGSGLTASLSTADPMPGVWEIVVTALPDAEGRHLTAAYSVSVEVPRAEQPLPYHYVVEPGEQVTLSVPVTNAGPPINGHVEAIGLAKTDPSQTWRMVQQLYQIDEFTLTGTAGLFLAEIENVTPASSDLDILLYRYDITKGWQRYWSAMSRQPGREILEYPNLPAGRYQVYVQHIGTTPFAIQYQYRRMAATQAYNLSAQDTTRHHSTGQTWEVPVKVWAPNSPGRYRGYLILMNDDTGESAAWFPIELSVGQPALTVQPMAARLERNEPGTVVLEVRNSETGELVDGPVLVDGQRYLTRQGRVTVPVRPTSRVHTMRIQVDLPEYQYYEASISLSVQDDVQVALPSGESDPETELWRRKLEALLPQ